MLKALWKYPVWSAVIAGSLLAAAGALGTYLLGFWPSIAAAFGTAWEWLFRSTLVPNWLLLVLIFSAIATVAIIGLVAWGFSTSNQKSGPHWSSYTQDTFFGLRWRWKYIGGRISNLHTFCPHCDYQVFAHNASAYDAIDRIGFNCDSCSRGLGAFNEPFPLLESKAERLIQQKLRNGTWSTQ
jgi:hypothetical protein